MTSEPAFLPFEGQTRKIKAGPIMGFALQLLDHAENGAFGEKYQGYALEAKIERIQLQKRMNFELI